MPEHAFKIRFDADLIEAVYLIINPSDDVERDRIYGILHQQERDEAFARYYAHWFRKSGFEADINHAFAEWPSITANCEEAVMRLVRTPSDEFAELFRAPEGCSRAGVGMRAHRLGDRTFLPWVRHELCHLSDMLDPAFAYPSQIPHDTTPIGHLTRDRYRILWDITIDARLARRFPDCVEFAASLTRHKIGFDRAFCFLPASERSSIFNQLIAETRPIHSFLWEMASDPRQIQEPLAPFSPGAICPVCGFTTFSWAGRETLEAVAPAIRSHFPQWTVRQGCCERCAEVYEAVCSAAIPATVLLPVKLDQLSLSNSVARTHPSF